MKEGKSFFDSLLKLWQVVVHKLSDLRTDSKSVVIIICLLVSTLFWLLKALNEEYSTEVELPIEFRNIPQDYSFYDNPPESLIVTVEDDGFMIIRYKFSFVFSSLKFDVSDYFEQKVESQNSGDITLNKSSLIKGIEEVLLSSTKIVNIFPEDIVIPFSKLREKKLPVQVMAEISTENQYIVNGSMMTVPDSVSVVGNEQQLAEIKAIYTQPVKAYDLKDTLKRKVDLQAIEGLEILQDEVQLTIPVEAYTEKILEVPIVGENFPDSLYVRTFPGYATVSCICGLSVYTDVQWHDFECYIDYNDVVGKNNGNIGLKIISNSKYAQRVTLREPTVDYLIEKSDAVVVRVQ